MGIDFERSVLRELDQIHRLIQDVVTELRSERDARESLDTEVSELKLKVDRLQHRLVHVPRPRGRALARDGGLVVSSGTLIALLNWWIASRQPPPPPQHFPAPSAQTVPSVPVFPVQP